MSVLIKDMEMPKSCNSCDLLQDYDGDMYCPLNNYLNFGDIENVPDYVMIGCPLSEVPERKKGKWIEISKLNHSYKCSVCGRMLINVTDGKNTVAKNYPFCHCGADMRVERREEISES